MKKSDSSSYFFLGIIITVYLCFALGPLNGVAIALLGFCFYVISTNKVKEIDAYFKDKLLNLLHKRERQD